MTRYPSHLLKLIDALRKLPGVGYKSAERFAFEMLNWPKEHLSHLADAISTVPGKLTHCQECGCLIDSQIACPFCHSHRAHDHTLCVVGTSREVFAIEETREYKGLYHVLGGLLSPKNGFGAKELKLDKLIKRIKDLQIKEVIIALDSTVEGDATSLYLRQELEPLNIQITRLAFGLPMGSALGYVDGGTLARAFSGRRSF